MILLYKKLKTQFGNIVCNASMHLYIQVHHIIINYAMNIVLTLIVWLVTHEFPYLIAHFVKNFSQNCRNVSYAFFLTNSTHKMSPCERIAVYELLFIFFHFFKAFKMTDMTTYSKELNISKL